jgi:hypothetical protein
MFSMVHIRLLGDGALFGFTYFSKNDRIEEFEHEDWNELNIYLVFIAITLRWY